MHDTPLSRSQVYEWFRCQRTKAVESGEILEEGGDVKPVYGMWTRYEEEGGEYVRMLMEGEVNLRTGKSSVESEMNDQNPGFHKDRRPRKPRARTTM